MPYGQCRVTFRNIYQAFIFITIRKPPITSTGTVRKSAVATAWSDPAWRRVRPPLVPLDDQAAAAVASDLEQAGFTFGG